MTLGRIVIPEPLPEGFALFYTTADFDGRTDDPELLTVLRDRFGIEASLETCNQVHGRDVSRVGAAAPGRAPAAGAAAATQGCDALYTDQRGVALGIKVADCLPVSLCDPIHRVIANIHSGWRGAAQQITAAALDTLAHETAFDPPSSYAYLGPSIRVCCFEVGEEVAVQFDERWIDRQRGLKPHVDLVKMTEDVLRERGVANVIDTGFCTRCDDEVTGLLGYSVTEQPSDLATQKPRFHSYRRAKRTGRNLAIAAQ
jgi:YfiH family protein